MTIKLNQIYESKVPHRSFDGNNSFLLFVPDLRKGAALGPEGEKLMLGPAQRRLLENVAIPLHNVDNKDGIKRKMLGQLLEVHEFPETLRRAGFGAGLLIYAERGDILKSGDVLSVIDQPQILESLKGVIEKHNEKVQSRMNTVSAMP